jgi:hypothetical protein
LARSGGFFDHDGQVRNQQAVGSRVVTMFSTTPIAAASRILDRIPFRVEVADLVRQWHGAAAGEDADDLIRLIDEAHRIGRPRALYVVSFVGEGGNDWVDVDAVRLRSRVLRVNLEGAYRVFPYVVTCGHELHDWTRSQPDLLREYWAQAISEMALGEAVQALTSYLEETYSLGPTASMSPGSLEDWPLEQQRALFDLFRGEEQRIGVQLTEHMLMQPTKTVSGIRYATEVAFESCQLCPREICEGRRAPFTPDLWATRYAATTPGVGYPRQARVRWRPLETGRQP